MKFHPLADRVLLKRIQEEEKTVSGLYIPNSAKEKPQEGEIVAVGPDLACNKLRFPPGINIGDHILFGKYSGTEIVLDGQEYLILKEEEIQGTLEY